MFDAHLLDGHVFVDIETTGLDAATAEVIELAAVFIRGGRIEAERSWLVRPSHGVPAMISALTGLTEAELEGAPSFAELAPSLTGLFDGWVVVAHNALFEKAFLSTLLDGPVLDSCELALLLFPELPSHALDALLKWTGRGAGAKHRALDDAKDTFAVVDALLRRACVAQRRLELQAMARRLQGPLQRLVTALADAAFDAPAMDEALPPLPTASALEPALRTWLEQPRTMALELERADCDTQVAELAREAARRHGSTWVVTGAPRRLALPQLPSRFTWKGGGRSDALTARRAVFDPSLSTALAYLESHRLRAPDVAGPSGFFRDRVPLYEGMRTLLRSPRAEPPGPGVCAGTHADVATWLARGARPQALVWLDAVDGPDHERRRLTITLDALRLAKLPELVELAAPGRPLSEAVKALHLNAALLFELLGAPSDDRAEAWATLARHLDTCAHVLDRLTHELNGAPPHPLITAVAEEAATLFGQARQLAHADPSAISLNATAISLKPSADDARAAWLALIAHAPSLLVSEVRRAEGWAAPFELVRVGQPAPRLPLVFVASLEGERAIAQAALADPERITLLSGEPLSEPLLRALAEVAAAQGRGLRLNEPGAGPRDVIVKDWWGGAPSSVSGPVVALSPREPTWVRRLVVADLEVRRVLSRGPVEPERYAHALDGLAWSVSASRAGP